MKRTKPKPKTIEAKKAEVPAITTHHLKAWRETFEPILSGDRTFDLRLDDRAFKVGHLIEFQEWDPIAKRYTGRKITKTIAYMLYGLSEIIARDPRWGLKQHYVILSLTKENDQ